MDLGDIKVEALNIMIIDNSTIVRNNLDNLLTDENFSPYLKRMNGSISRCLGDIEHRKLIAPQIKELSGGVVESNSILRFSNYKTSEIYQIKDIKYKENGNIYENISFGIMGNDLLVDNREGTYYIEYYPTIPRLTSSTENSYVIVDGASKNLPNELLEIIPFYVKGELYRDDDVNEAGESMNWYEQKIAQLEVSRDKYQTQVDSVYEMQY